MLTRQTLLHATDFSDSSQHAFQLACSLARDYDARLVVLHVNEPPLAVYGGMMALPPVPPEDPREEAETRLRDLANNTTKVRLETQIREGDPAEQILKAAAETKCNLLVLGTHGRTGLGRLLMGSVAEQVTRRAPCPVLTVKTPLSADKERVDEEELVESAT